MEKKAAESLIKDTFNAKFNLEQYTLFMRNLLKDYDEDKERDWAQGNYIYESFREHINRFKRLGIYTDPEGNEVELLVIETKATSKLERARTSLRNFVIKRLNDKSRDYALAAFYSKEDNGEDWRFSYIKIEHESYKDQKGKVKTKKELTPAKRFSFLVGEHEHAYTAQKQLLPVLQNDYSNPNIEDLESCFSIEKVTDEFFEQYKELYLKLSEHLSNDKSVQKILNTAGIDSNRFTKKLLGQIVFLYFLQKKGWLGVPKNEPWGKGEKKFVQALYEEAIAEKKDFFKDYLQYLFYEALAKARTKSPDPSYYKRFDCKIPFLNGGLFEADYDWQNANLSIPNNLFRNDEKNKAGDKGTGVLDVFDRYNFTIKEDEPLEKEVAVDPEMLGKVFENMLEITERKSKGAFYTPREIVHYMCQESLINYLDNAVNDATESYQAIDSDQLRMFEGAATKKGQAKIEIQHKGKILIPKDDIELFVHKGFLATENDIIIMEKGKETRTYRFQLPESVRINADTLDEKLTSIKICDPAIGSGAFPVGLLHELVTAQKVLLPYLSEAYLYKKLKEIDLDRADFSKDPTKYIYRVKRHAIQESIYGVDIDASAIDIARLRLWLSLIVDEDDFYSIEALPNLDYKIVHGSSLIGLPDNAMKDLKTEAELEKLKDAFFNETNETEKKRLRTKINTTIRKLLDSAEQFAGYKIDFDFKLVFSEVWHYNKGFDIVIANPPYVEHKKLKAIASALKPIYEVYSGSSDLSVYFFEKGFKLLKSNGTLTYINTNKFFNTGYGKELRRYLLKYSINFIVNFEQVEIFDRVLVSSLIFNASKKSPTNEHNFTYTGFYKDKNWRYTFLDKIFNEQRLLKQNSFNESEWTFAEETDLKLRKKIESEAILLKDLPGVQIKRGVTTGYDPAFIIDEKIKKELKEDTVKPLLKGREIKKYYNSNNGLFLIFTRRGIDISKYPKTKSYLQSFKKELEPKKSETQKIGRKPGDYSWYEIQDNTAYYPLFERDKIIWPLTADKWGFTIDYGKHFLTSGGFFLVSQTQSLKYLLAILNSQVMEYYFSFIGVMTAGGAYTLKKATIEDFPIKAINSTELIEVLVSYALFLKPTDSHLICQYFEEIIDAIVFELYFKKELENANKTVLKHIISVKPIDEKMSPEKKLSIIQAEFNRLYDPNHPVRNNLETLDSVEEIRIIKRALK